MNLYFSQHFRVDPTVLDDYGAFDISVVSDLPLFVDPFLLFNSEKPEYRGLHEGILRYLLFLRDQASEDLDPALIDSWYRFKEVRQNWLGFTLFGNGGAGLGRDFALALHGALGQIFQNFGEETITRGSHLEKLCLIRPGVGRDNISDFTTNLIKGYLLDYTQTFASDHLRKEDCRVFAVERANFNYQTRTWMAGRYYLPRLGQDFVLLTPLDLLTRDETWISQPDMVRQFHLLPAAVSDAELRGQIEQYFKLQLGRRPTETQRRQAISHTIQRFPELIDRYIRLREDAGDRAESVSAQKVDETWQALVAQIRQAVTQLEADTDFYDLPWQTSYRECLARVHFFKSFIEDNDGYRLLNRAGQPFSREEEVQLAFGLVWGGSELDANREVNNGRGPVDFKVSYGARDTSLIEFKLASNTQLKRNMEKQIAIYQKANRTPSAVKAIVSYTEKDEMRAKRILAELGLANDESIVLIDARADNKPSASKA